MDEKEFDITKIEKITYKGKELTEEQMKKLTALLEEWVKEKN